MDLLHYIEERLCPYGKQKYRVRNLYLSPDPCHLVSSFSVDFQTFYLYSYTFHPLIMKITFTISVLSGIKKEDYPYLGNLLILRYLI